MDNSDSLSLHDIYCNLEWPLLFWHRPFVVNTSDAHKVWQLSMIGRFIYILLRNKSFLLFIACLSPIVYNIVKIMNLLLLIPNWMLHWDLRVLFQAVASTILWDNFNTTSFADYAYQRFDEGVEFHQGQTEELLTGMYQLRMMLDERTNYLCAKNQNNSLVFCILMRQFFMKII